MTAAPLTPRCQATERRRSCHFRRKTPSCNATQVPVPTRCSTPFPAPLLTDIYEILLLNYSAFGAFVKIVRDRFDNNIFARCKNFSVLTLEFFAQRKSVGFLHHFQDFRLQRQHSADIQGVPRAVGPALHAVETVVHMAGNDGHAVLSVTDSSRRIFSVSTSRRPMIW